MKLEIAFEVYRSISQCGLKEIEGLEVGLIGKMGQPNDWKLKMNIRMVDEKARRRITDIVNGYGLKVFETTDKRRSQKYLIISDK